MRQLRYAGPGEDAAHVVVEALDGSDRYTLVLDDALRAAARQELPKPGGADDAPVTLSPRDIQTRVRGGASPEAIAEEAGLPLDKVMRFAFPVLQERVRVSDEARRARARRTTPTGEMAVFGEVVDGRLAAHGVDPADVAWDAFRRVDGQWTVTAGWRDTGAGPSATGTDRFAQWTFALASRVITPLDETAGDLLSDRPLRPIGVDVDDDPEDVATVGGPYDESTLADPRHPTGPIPGGLRLAPPVFDGPDGPPEPAPPAAHADPFVGADWPADPAPRGLGSFFDRPTAHTATRAEAPVPAASVDAAELVDPAEPLLPFAFEAPDANAPTGRRFRGRHDAEGEADPDSAEGKAARARIPSWDDILLGVRRRTD
ncbi:septation protein SepH [Jatrophihabitans sp. YIM 134969]